MMLECFVRTMYDQNFRVRASVGELKFCILLQYMVYTLGLLGSTMP